MPKNALPQHVAIIMDGNGRWAVERGLPRIAGHRAGAENVRTIVQASAELGISHLTLYAFSQENWKRPKEEVALLMNLLDYFLNEEIKKLHAEGIRLRTIGRVEALPEPILKKLRDAAEFTKNNSRMTLNLALNYGSRAEILDAVKQLIHRFRSGGDPETLTEDIFSEALYTQGMPDPDLLIRTSGEMRLSNFLLWQLSYAEIYITKKYWPDFKKEDYLEAIEAYKLRERRFGDVTV